MSVTELHLQDRLTRLSLAPELGASLVNWEVKATGQALLRHSDLAALESGTPRRLACYPLAPWSNRIGEGGFARPEGGRHWHPIPGMTLTRSIAVPGSRPGRWSITVNSEHG